MNLKTKLSGYGFIIAAGIISVVTLSALTSISVNLVMKPKIVSLDIKETTSDFVQQTAVLGSRISKDQLKAMTGKFNLSLQKTIGKYKDNGYVVIVSPAIITGVPDITADVQKEISKDMKGG